VVDVNPPLFFHEFTPSDHESRYARDLTADARKGLLDPVICRDDEIRRCIQILSRRSKNNPVLIGEPGVGKTAISEALAQRIVAGESTSRSLNPGLRGAANVISQY
jgi:ATP-dependent Clp protease ATP-binding subunit ClpA